MDNKGKPARKSLHVKNNPAIQEEQKQRTKSGSVYQIDQIAEEDQVDMEFANHMDDAVIEDKDCKQLEQLYTQKNGLMNFEGYLIKKNILGRRNTQYYVLEPENFKINYGPSKKKTIKCIYFSDKIQEAQDENEDFVMPHKKNIKKFIINMGFGKNAQQLKYEASTGGERDLWVKALLMMAENYKVVGRSKSVENVEKAPKSLLKKVVGSLARKKTIKKHEEHEESLQEEEEHKEQNMTLTEMADYLMGQESHFSKTLENSLEQYTLLKDHLSFLDKETSKKQMDQSKVKKTVESTKTLAENFMTQQVKVFEEVRRAQKNLHQMIESLAEREQTSDLREFLRRESVIPKNLSPEEIDEEINKAAQIKMMEEQLIEIPSIKRQTPENRHETEMMKVQEGEENKFDKENDSDEEAKQVEEPKQIEEEPDIDPPQQVISPKSLIPENLQESKTPPKNEIKQLVAPCISSNEVNDNSLEDEDRVDSDIEDLFLDALGEIQEASVKLNQTLASARLSKTGPQNFESFASAHQLDTDAFEDANDQSIQVRVPPETLEIEACQVEEDPRERSELPWFKDPNIKVSIWAIIKDSIGKDISKISVPVYFNDPTSLLQKCAQSLEYNHILDSANALDDISLRLAYIGVHSISQVTICERNATKPFNPILGETYEFVTDDLEFISEQVSHHPPLTANFCRGRKSNYTFWNNQKTNTKFTGKHLDFIQQYKTYIELKDHNETYEINAPVFSAHNLIIGTPYVDLGGSSSIRILEQQDFECQLRYTKRGWISRDEFKVEGEVTKKGKKLYKIHGHWNSKVFVTPFKENGKLETSQEICVFTKNPYPERWDYMYGMSHFSLQLNYFPRQLEGVIPPTDTRRRPDQRSLENGDMILAAKEKERLELKQRQRRKLNEQNGIEHQPAYFKTFDNPSDGQTYFVYNERYFEQDRPNQDWSRLPDLFGYDEESEEETLSGRKNKKSKR